MASSFDPYRQNLTFHYANGTPFNVSVVELNDWIQNHIKVSINYGAQLGASIIALAVVVSLSRWEKRRMPVFFLNTFALAVNIARITLLMTYRTTHWVHPYSRFSGDFARMSAKDYARSVLGTIISWILLATVEISLLIQTQILCANLPKLQRLTLLAVSSMVALVAIGFRFGYMVVNCIQIMKASSMANYVWFSKATHTTLTISMFYFSVIFVIKLGYALVTRRRLGMTRFGALQVMFIMSCQTMIIPAIFAILQYPLNDLAFTSNVLTVVVIFMPLSAIWASVATKHSFETKDSQPHQYIWSSERRNSISSCPSHTLRSGTSTPPKQVDPLDTQVDASEKV
ncbi:hypothetical protein AJ79_06008 [Helicocarpus griseus UAMH5409]|uniref:Pheromone alpha factor receptor n=1 Tax=Helicocarpus griseus UAMH5409 TaxID=1447875 RepID=A0A2B7XHS1_9EURO|nr:hypothetical protein AJ79_06008 [Helicocarpus griseus UAMH5409]